MIYFKKVDIGDVAKADAENLLRSASLKRNTPLDLMSTSTDVGSDKLFYGKIGKSELYFTRLRTSFERFLPTLIIKFPLNTDQCYYQIRFSLLSSFLFVFWSGALLSSIVYLALGVTTSNSFAFVLLVYIIYGALIVLELKITSKRIDKVLRQSTFPQRF